MKSGTAPDLHFSIGGGTGEMRLLNLGSTFFIITSSENRSHGWFRSLEGGAEAEHRNDSLVKLGQFPKQ